MTRAPLWLDVDTGVDDALAIALAVRAGANLVGVSTVAGNVPIDFATDNTRVAQILIDGNRLNITPGQKVEFYAETGYRVEHVVSDSEISYATSSSY